MSSPLFDAALEYQALSWRVVPIRYDPVDNTKKPPFAYTNLKDVDPATGVFTEQFNKYPECLSIAKIVSNDEIVIDIDGGEWPEMPVTPTVKTPRGFHYHLKRPLSLKMEKAQIDFEDGMEVKGPGMLANIAPGLHPSGVRYEWLHGPETPLAALPGWITDKINKYSEAHNEGKKLLPDELETILQGVREGAGRNKACMRLGGHYIGRGMLWDEIQTLVVAWNNKNRPPMRSAELTDCLKSLRRIYLEKDEKKPATEALNRVEEISTEELNALVEKEQTLRLSLSLPDDHFISKYTKWMSSITDAYYEYNVCGALWLLSACVEGNFYLKLKQDEVHPNLWINCLGKSTTSRKTTAINKAKGTYEAITNINLYNDDYSLEGYLESLAERPVQHFVRDEAAGLLAKMHKQYNEGIFEAECAIYDGSGYKKTLSAGKAKTPKVFEVKDPYVTHFYATTPDNYAMIMTLMDFLCGYGIRFLFCCPKYKKPRMDLELETVEDVESWAAVIVTLKKLRHLIQNNNVKRFVATPEAMTLYNNMVKELEEVCESQDNEMLNAAVGRNQTHILKIAMLLEIGKAEPSFCITEDSMRIAFNMVVNFFLPSLFDVISRLQTDAKNNQVERVIGSLRNLGGKATRSKLLQNTHLKSKEFNECIDTLVESEVIRAVQEKGQKAITYILMDTNDISQVLARISDFSSFSVLSSLAQSTKSLAKLAKMESGAGNINKIEQETPRVAQEEVQVLYANVLKPLNRLNVLNPQPEIDIDFFLRISQEWQVLNKATVNSSNLDKFLIYALMRHGQAGITNVSREALADFSRHHFKLSSVPVIHVLTEDTADEAIEALMRGV